MRTIIVRNGITYSASQDRRGLSSEADLIINEGITEIYRRSHPKFQTKEEMAEASLEIIEEILRRSR